MINPLQYSQIYHSCDASLFTFKSTEELKPLEQPIVKEGK